MSSNNGGQRSRLRRNYRHLESSSEEPTSSEEPISDINKDASKILWVSNTGWHTWTNQLGYPRPQGNIPMLLALTPQKQDSLLRAYFSVHGDAADYANTEWMPYQDQNQR